ncbi:MAG: RnfH family protein [Gammaproteobacteria bacterium]|nr:RnfH family protein [Gammaproteobacteria bacterium]
MEVVWVDADQSVACRTLALPRGSRVADALVALRADESAAEVCRRLARGELQTAIYGERCESGAALHAGDRIELLAGLSVDPKVARRRRADEHRALGARSKRRGEPRR